VQFSKFICSTVRALKLRRKESKTIILTVELYCNQLNEHALILQTNWFEPVAATARCVGNTARRSAVHSWTVGNAGDRQTSQVTTKKVR